MNTVHKDTNSIQKQIDRVGYRLAIAEAGRYYGLPLADCLITEHNVNIGLHIPILKEAISTVQMQRLISAPLAWQNLTCMLETEHIDLARYHNQTK